MRVVQRQVVDHARDLGVHVAAAEVLGRDDFAGGRLHDRRAAEEDRALVLHDDRLVRHRGHVGAARSAGTHDHGDLRDARGRHVGLVVEDAPEVLAVREDVVLVGQVRTARVDEVDAGELVLDRDFLRAQVLFHGHREVGAPFDGRVIGDDHAFAPGDAADAGDDGGRGDFAAIHAESRQLADLEERCTRVEERAHALAGQELAAGHVLLARGLVAAHGDLRDLLAQVGDQRLHALGVGLEIGRARVELGLEDRHQAFSLCAGLSATGRPAFFHWPRPPSRWSTFSTPISASVAADSTPRQSAAQ